MCETKRSVVREWELLNIRERGGIAKPAVLVVDPGFVVRYAGVDTVASRVPASEILSFLVNASATAEIRRKTYFPLPGDWIRAIRNNSRKD